MKVELEITFSEKEVLAMCLEKCQRIETAVEGSFKAQWRSWGEVVCTFSPKHAEDSPAPVMAEAILTTLTSEDSNVEF